jgi:hypothetical protein
MKILLASIALVLFASSAHANSVSGYIRRDGTYVQPYQRSAPNSFQYDNYSTSGNTNPFTGKRGTHHSYDSFGNDCTGFC